MIGHTEMYECEWCKRWTAWVQKEGGQNICASCAERYFKIHETEEAEWSHQEESSTRTEAQ